jgi:prepilin-type N-terminal cleavage/methylation domain-containing protein
MEIRFNNPDRGFTLVELMMAIAIGLLVMGLAVAAVPSMMKTAKADSGLDMVVAGLRAARELSTSDRRNVQLQFVGTNTLKVNRVEYPSGTLTTMRTFVLEGRVEFRLVTGVPDTPDAFGNASATALGTHTPAMFTTDGSFVDSNGDVLNGTLFLAVPGDSLSARAVTIFGPTGAMRQWRWNGRAWVEL